MDLAALWAPFSRQLSSPTTPLSTALSNEESKAAEEARRFARHASAALARPSMLLWTHCRSRNSDTAHQDVLREAIELGGAPLPGGQFSSLDGLEGMWNKCKKLMLVTLKGASVPALADNPEAQHLLNDYSVMLTALSMLQLDNLSSQGKQVSVLASSDTGVFAIEMAVGNILCRMGETSNAIETYTNLLQRHPMALEAATKLLRLGVPLTDVLEHIPLSMSQSEPWIQPTLHAFGAFYSQDYASSVNEFSLLVKRYPDQPMFTLYLAASYSKEARYLEAVFAFKKARTMDPYNLTYMDTYVEALMHLKRDSEATKLADDLLRIDSRRPEGWVAQGHCLSMTDGAHDTALTAADMAIQLASYYAPAYSCRGDILYNCSQYDEAILFYQASYKLHPDIEALDGLVHTHIVHQGKLNEALTYAKVALDKSPNSARALTMVGAVFAKDPKKRDKINPESMEAVITLAGMHQANGEFATAIELLERYSSIQTNDNLHARLGDLYLASRDFAKAMQHFFIAINLNKNNFGATNGLIRLDRALSSPPQQDDSFVVKPEDD